MDSRPVRAAATEQALASGGAVADAAALASEGLDPPADGNAGVDFRRHLASVLVRRALAEAGA
jgi:carbon-monoxide dehydrogenase medium subunit